MRSMCGLRPRCPGTGGSVCGCIAALPPVLVYAGRLGQCQLSFELPFALPRRYLRWLPVSTLSVPCAMHDPE